MDETKSTNGFPSEYNIGLFGLPHVGRSTLVITKENGHFMEEYDPTIESGYKRSNYVDGIEAHLNILNKFHVQYFDDMKSEDELIGKSEALILVYSITNRKSFEYMVDLYKKILDVKIKFQNQELSDLILILCGNKCDLEDERYVTTEEGQKLANEWNVPFYETSAKNMINVDEIFAEAVRLIRKKYTRTPEPEIISQTCECCVIL